jgi:hypothetical protein
MPFLLIIPRCALHWAEREKSRIQGRRVLRTDFDILDENIRLCDEKTVRFLKMMIIDHEFFYQQHVTVDGISIIILPFPVLKIRNLVCNAVVPSQN